MTSVPVIARPHAPRKPSHGTEHDGALCREVNHTSAFADGFAHTANTMGVAAAMAVARMMMS